MAQFYDETFGVEKMSAGQLDAIALAGGQVGSIGYGYARSGNIPPLAGGWSAVWVNTAGMGNHGRLVLRPTDHRTRAIAREGAIKQYLEAGMTRQQAERYHSAAAQYKRELATLAAVALQDPLLQRAIGAYPEYLGKRYWLEAWGEVIPQEFQKLTHWRLDALATLVNAAAE